MRTSAEEGRYRNTQAKEVKAVAFHAYALLAAVALTIRVAVIWAALF